VSTWGDLDHVIIFCDTGAPEAQALIDRGFHEGPTNSHPGQGTANRRFFFPNVYLELLWVSDATEARGPQAGPTRLWDRWDGRARGACPFGCVFRPGKRNVNATFDCWTYSPRYFPPGFSIEVASNPPPNEPLLFYLPFARPALVEDSRHAPKPLVGPIVAATVHLPDTDALSPALHALVAAGLLTVEPAREYLLDLFHVSGAAESIDLRPVLPLRFVPAARSADVPHSH
jgi:hypothetical protein